LISAGLYLNVYPKSERFPAYSWILRLVGLVGVIGLLAIFRQTTQGGQAAWLDFSYPEILGLIGFSYLAAAILYIPSRRWAWAPLVWFGLLASLNVLTAARLVTFTEHLPLYLWPFGNGAMSCIVMAGVVTSSIFLGTGRRPAQGRSMFLATVFGILMLAAGMAMTPFGISKIRATPTWSLYSIGASVLLFTLLYWVCDVRHWTRWAFLVRPAGSNTLLTYLLPDLWEYALAAMGITYLETHFNRGWQGVVETFVFTVLILSLAKVLTKARVRLQL
jgi:heparan-alpha-glucosaminide N-acetyltransferase